MDIEPKFQVGYTPNAADEGSFVPLDTSTLTDYPSAGFGKYARLVYIMGDEGTKGTFIDHSGTTTGGIQTLMPANSAREIFMIQNISDTTMWVSEMSAVSGSPGAFSIAINEKYVSPSHFCTTQALYLYCTASGKAFTAKEG